MHKLAHVWTSSSVIEDIMSLHDGGTAFLAYFYCDFRDEDKQNYRNLLLSILSQLCARSNLCCDIVSRVYATHGNGTRKPSDDALADCLNKMLSLPDQGPIYIIMDALDESPNNCGIPSPRERVLQFVKELVELCIPNLHVCVMSRPEIDIRDVFEPLTSRRVSLHDQSGQKEDIADYVRSVVFSNSEQIMGRWRMDDKELVVKTLSERANGM